MKTLLAINKNGNITKAADSLGTSQPALSRLLTKIESDLDVKLFYRRQAGLQPTKEGEIYLETFENVLQIFDETKKKIKTLYNELVDEFTLGAHPVIAKFLVPEIENSLSKTPTISLDYRFMNSRQVTEEVLLGKLDFGVVADAQKYPELIIKPLWRQYIGLYSVDGTPKDQVIFNSQMISSNRILKDIEFKEQKAIDDYDIIYSLLENNQSMGLLPSPIAESENRLKLIQKCSRPISISLIYRSDLIKNQSLKKVVTVIKAAASQ